jgi:hypothetical protein
MIPNDFNYHHLLYFWAVGKEGSLRSASEVLHVSQPSISAAEHLVPILSLVMCRHRSRYRTTSQSTATLKSDTKCYTVLMFQFFGKLLSRLRVPRFKIGQLDCGISFEHCLFSEST